MNIHEQIQDIESQIDKTAYHRGEAMKQNDHELAVLNMKYHFMSHVELGLIQWRLGQSPVNRLKHALDSLLQDREALLELDAEPELICDLPLHHSTFLASLLNVPHPTLDINQYDPAMAAQIFLGNVLIGADSIVNWTLHQNKLPLTRKYALVRSTYDLYAGLLAGAVPAKNGVVKAEIYYKRRENDGYFNGAPIILGGVEANDRYVDFQLAAVLKHIGSTVPSIHAWRW